MSVWCCWRIMSYTLATFKIHVLKINAIFLFTAQLIYRSSNLGELCWRCGGNLMAVVIHTCATPLKLAKSNWVYSLWLRWKLLVSLKDVSRSLKVGIPFTGCDCVLSIREPGQPRVKCSFLTFTDIPEEWLIKQFLQSWNCAGFLNSTSREVQSSICS